ncbi:hypothetical protein LXL04_013975 [Taraxacum kok-saghyz]
MSLVHVTGPKRLIPSGVKRTITKSSSKISRTYAFSTDHSVFYLSPTLTISRVSVNANRQSLIAISNLQSQFQIANRQCNSKSLIANRQSQVCSRSLIQLQVVTPHQVTLLSRSLLQLQIATLSLGRHPSGNLGRAEKVEPPKHKASKSPRGFDDLLPGFGSGGPASGSRSIILSITSDIRSPHNSL